MTLEIPTWMFDRSRCAEMRVRGKPYVAWEALEELRVLIRDVDNRIGPLPEKEAVHVQKNPPESTRSLSGANGSPEVARSSRPVAGRRSSTGETATHRILTNKEHRSKRDAGGSP